jgi:hypothetical protein
MANTFEMNVFSGKAKGGGTADGTSAIAREASPTRKYLGIFNLDNTNILWLSLGSAAVAGEGIPVFPRSSWEMQFGKISGDAVHVITEGANVDYSWFEGA